jgi:hypothetical protein
MAKDAQRGARRPGAFIIACAMDGGLHEEFA